MFCTLTPVGCRLVIAIPGSRKPVYRDLARFFNTEIPVLRRPNTEIFGIGLVSKGAHSKASKMVEIALKLKGSSFN